MRVIVENTAGHSFELKDISELTLIQTYGVACDAASISFRTQADIGEIVGVRLYYADTPVFNGRCDKQQLTVSSNGSVWYIYARSLAAILVDSKAQPFTFDEPTAKQLFINYARDKGFTCELPEIVCRDRYEVSLGTSRFGAINNFVSLLTGSEIYVDCNGCIKLHSSSYAGRLDSYDILTLTKTINRSEPITQINFKSRTGDEYNLHTRAVTEQGRGIDRVDFVNLSSLPQWQRDYTIEKRLRNSFADYKTVRAKVRGWCSEETGSLMSCSTQDISFDDYVLREKKYCLDSSGDYTCLLLSMKTDMEAITYVD